MNKYTQYKAEVAGTGMHVPKKVLTNFDLEKTLDTSDEWIRTRTGIRERRIAGEGESSSTLAAQAGNQALNSAGVAPEEVDLIIVCTSTPDILFPSTACFVQKEIGAVNAAAYDISAVCSGFVFGLSIAEQYLKSGRYRYVLVIGSETNSRIVDWTDRSTCILFGDGAGAVVLRKSNGSGRGILSSHLRSDGKLADLLYRPGGGSTEPISQTVLDNRRHLIRMEGREIFKNAVRSMAEACDFALQQAGLTADDVDLLVPHQANVRIIEATAKYAGIDMGRVYVNVDRYGNMSSASVPVGLDEALEKDLIGPGSNVLTAAFGAGLTWGATVLRW